jgi:hypothetical protein
MPFLSPLKSMRHQSARLHIPAGISILVFDFSARAMARTYDPHSGTGWELRAKVLMSIAPRAPSSKRITASKSPRAKQSGV